MIASPSLSTHAAVPSMFRNMTPEQIKADILDCVTISVEKIARAAEGIKYLDSVGVDLSDLPRKIVSALRRVAHGQAVPEVIVSYSDDPPLMQQLLTLPLPDQKRLSGPTARLEVVTASGEIRRVHPRDLTGLERRQVFCSGEIRTASQQRGFIEDQKKRQASAPTESEDVIVDKKRGGLVVGDRFLSRSELLSLLSRLD